MDCGLKVRLWADAHGFIVSLRLGLLASKAARLRDIIKLQIKQRNFFKGGKIHEDEKDRRIT